MDDNIDTNSKEILREGVDWIHLAQDRVQGQAVLNTIVVLPVP